MPRKRVAIVVAMRSEVAPLLHGATASRIDGVPVFVLEHALVAVGGIGTAAAKHAAEVAVREAQPELLVSAGLAGALTPNLKVGDVVVAGTVVNAATGQSHVARGGTGKLVTAEAVHGIREKQQLAAVHQADAVEMEAAAVAEIAAKAGIEFAAVKAISDEYDFKMPPLARFVEPDGRFATGRFIAYLLLRPWWWPAVVRLSGNSRLAAVKLSSALQHLISEQWSSDQGAQIASEKLGR